MNLNSTGCKFLRADHGTKIVYQTANSLTRSTTILTFIYRATLIIKQKSTDIISFVAIKQRGTLKKREKKIKHRYVLDNLAQSYEIGREGYMYRGISGVSREVFGKYDQGNGWLIECLVFYSVSTLS